jgi:hypothetical protein
VKICKLFLKFVFLFLVFPFLAKAQFYETGSAAFGQQSATLTFYVYFNNELSVYDNYDGPFYLNSVQGNSSAFTLNAPSYIPCCTTAIYLPVQFNADSVPVGSKSATLVATYGECQYCQTMLTLTVSATGTAVSYGSINPKYVVLSVVYAPPGHKSTVDYGTSTSMGTSNSFEQSFSNSTTITQSFNATIPLFGSVDRKNSVSWTQTADSTSSVTVNKSTSDDLIVPGPVSDDAGIDHDYDQILVWVNPVAEFTLTGPNSAQWNYAFDQRDPANEMDVVPLYVTWLKNPSTIPAGVASTIARTWASNNADGSGPGLTTADFAAILARDPFANGQTTIDSTRFDLEAGHTFFYVPPPCGGQPDTQTYKESYQMTSNTGTTATDTYSVSYSESSQPSFLNWLQSNFTASQTLTWTNKWGHQTTQGSGEFANLSITGPGDCTYAGKTDAQVYQDNVYGTYLFNFFQ